MADFAEASSDEKDDRFRTYTRDLPIKKRDDDQFRHGDYADVLYAMVRDTETPFNVGVYGRWGVGKSSVLEILKSRLDDEPELFSCVKIDAWGLSADMLKHGIFMEVIRQTYTCTDEEEADEILYSVKEEKATGRWAAALNAAAMALTVGAVAISAWVSIVDKSLAERHEALLPIVATLAGTAILTAWRSTVVYKSKARPATISTIRFRDAYKDLIKKIKKLRRNEDHRLVVIVDNLDRCESPKAVELLGIIQTFIAEEGCVNVIACDSDAIKKHVAHTMLYEHETGAEEEIRAGSSGAGRGGEFLEKFFQATIAIPEIPPINLRKYVDQTLKKHGLDTHQNLAHVFLAGAIKNPRKIGTYMNDLTARLHLAEMRERSGRAKPGAVTGNAAFLAKLLIIEHEWPELYRGLEAALSLNRLKAKGGGAAMDRKTAFLVATTDITTDDIKPFLRLGSASHDLETIGNRFCDEIFLNDAGEARRVLGEVPPEDHPYVVARVEEDVQLRMQRPGDPAVKNCLRSLPRVVEMLSGGARRSAISVISTCVIHGLTPMAVDDDEAIILLLPEMEVAEDVFEVITARHFQEGAFDPDAWSMLIRNCRHMPRPCAEKMDAELAKKYSADQDAVLGLLASSRKDLDWCHYTKGGKFWRRLVGSIEFSAEPEDRAKRDACTDSGGGECLGIYALLSGRFVEVAGHSPQNAAPGDLYSACGRMEPPEAEGFLSAALTGIAAIKGVDKRKNAIYHTGGLIDCLEEPVPASVTDQLAEAIGTVLREERRNEWAIDSRESRLSQYFDRAPVISAFCDNMSDQPGEPETALMIEMADDRNAEIAIRKLEKMSKGRNIAGMLTRIVDEKGSDWKGRNKKLTAWVHKYCRRART